MIYMENLNQEQLKEMMLLSYRKIEENKEQINKINVFPVPDQDTGNNLAKTLSGIKDAVEGKEFKNLTEIAEAALDGALTTAQGNAGVIYTGFLAGFFAELVEPLDAKKLATAFDKGSVRARQSIQNPKQGTILDVIDATAEVFKNESETEKDILLILKKATEKAREALLATREKMDIFIKANVVDAGGMGFLLILESYLEALEGPAAVKFEKPEEKPSEKVKRFIQNLAYRYEVVSLVENPKMDELIVREKLKKLGNCLDIVQARNKMKIHIHTDYTNEVQEIIRGIGEVKSLRVEDMAKEVMGEESVRKVTIGLVTEDVASLPEKVIERYQIETVSLNLDRSDIDRFSGENIFQKMKEAEKAGVLAKLKTAQATPRSYLLAFEKQLQKFEKVICLTISSKVSGSFNSARQAAEMLARPYQVFVIDSKNAAAGQALLVLRAVELIQEQREMREVIDEIRRLIPLTYLDTIVSDPKWLEAGGRITKAQANWIRRMRRLNLYPFMIIKDGSVVKGKVVWAQDKIEAMFKKIAKDSQKYRKAGKKIRVLINQTDNQEEAESLRKRLKEINAEVPFITLAPPVIGAHVGPGTLIVAWQPI